MKVLALSPLYKRDQKWCVTFIRETRRGHIHMEETHSFNDQAVARGFHASLQKKMENL